MDWNNALKEGKLQFSQKTTQSPATTLFWPNHGPRGPNRWLIWFWRLGDLTARFSILSFHTYPVARDISAIRKQLWDVFRPGSHLPKDVWELKKTEKRPLPTTISIIHLHPVWLNPPVCAMSGQGQENPSDAVYGVNLMGNPRSLL